MAFIKLDYDIAVTQAEEIRKAGNSCIEVADDLSKQIAAINEGWDGGTSDALIDKLTEMQKKYREIGNNLKKYANEIKGKAAELRAIDESK